MRKQAQTVLKETRKRCLESPEGVPPIDKRLETNKLITRSPKSMVLAYLTLTSGSQLLGRLDLVLYDETVPKTVENFCHFLKESKAGKGYLQSSFHRIIKGFMAQGGDFMKGDGTGSTSIFGPSFADENFVHGHDRPGKLSMANSGKDTNGSQFFITFRATPHLDGKHVVFGHVDLTSPTSRAVLKALENVRTGAGDRPILPITVVECGIVGEAKTAAASSAIPDENATVETVTKAIETNPEDENELDLPEEEEEEEVVPKTKAEALKLRMRKLKMKMNQARQLNQREVLREGERLGSVEGAAKAKKRQMIQDKKSKEAEWKERNSKAFEIANEHGIDGKYLVEQADSSLKKSFKKREKAEANLFEINDFHNPEGQHRNYQRDLKSLPHGEQVAEHSTGTFDPTMNMSNEARDRQGGRIIANEMRRRIEKREKNKRKKIEFEQEDVSYINQRNKRFNQKISRNYDKYTAEIRQNLERGTAL